MKTAFNVATHHTNENSERVIKIPAYETIRDFNGNLARVRLAKEDENGEKYDIVKEIIEASKWANIPKVSGLILYHLSTASDRQEAIRDILKASIETDNARIVRMVERNGASIEELKGENLKDVLSSSIKSKNSTIVNYLFSCINGLFKTGDFNDKMEKSLAQSLVIQALESKNEDIALKLLKEARLENFDSKGVEKAVDMALGYRNKQVIHSFLDSAASSKLEFPEKVMKKLLDVATKTNDDYIIDYMINHGDNGKYALQKILKYAIDGNDTNLKMKLYQKATFDKESFNMLFGSMLTAPEYNLDRIDEKHYNFFIDLSEKADINTYKSLFLDQKIGDKINNVLMTQNLCQTLIAKEFTAQGEKLLAKKILVSIRDAEMKINDRDISKESPNLVEQLLSLKSNASLLIEFQELVYKSYNDIIKESLDKNPELKEVFPAEQVFKSMKRSEDFIRKPESFKLDEMTNHMGDFMIVPLYVPGHCFGGFIRKLDDGNFSMTAINLGARPFEKGSHSYMEFVFDKKDNLQKIIDKYGYADFKGLTNVTSCYREFKEKSSVYYTLNTESRLQKTGNCFTKNPEKCVRYGLSLVLEQIDNPEFKQESIRGKTNFRPTHLKKLVGGKVRINEVIVERLSQLFPENKDEFQKTLGIYKRRKNNGRQINEDKEANYEMHPFIFREKENRFGSMDKTTSVLDGKKVGSSSLKGREI